MSLSKVFESLDERELEYVLARVDAKSNAEALRNCGFSQGWLNNRDIDDLNQRAHKIRINKAVRASIILEEATVEAAKVKAKGLKSRDERVKQAVATEILDRALGKPTQRQDITTDGSKITIRLVGNDDD